MVRGGSVAIRPIASRRSNGITLARLLAASIGIATCTACGQKGPLTLPKSADTAASAPTRAR